uniref:Uncharacterized protein n=1 Tax=Hyaloperonospora arabidopsidis (strain Emoy2) TaxID=559515 RepID=M4BRE8_HYAAE
MRLQGHRLTLIKKESIVQQLIVHLMLTIGMKRYIGGFSDMDTNRNAIRLDCAVEYSNTSAFVEDLGHFEMKRLAAIDDHTRATLLANISSLIFGIIEEFFG